MADKDHFRQLSKGSILSLPGFRNSLWIGADYLLNVEHRGFHERYRRFYFDDIQALIIRRTQRRFVVGLALGVVLLIGLVMLAFSSGLGWRIFGGSLTAVLGTLSLINLAKGAACVCHVQTSVSLTEISVFKRIKQVERALPEIRVRIAGIQGEIATEALAAGLEARQAGLTDSDPGIPPPVERFYSGVHPARGSLSHRASVSLHLGLFGLLLVDVVLVLIMFWGSFPVVVGARVVVVMGAAFFAITALAGKRRQIAPSLLRTSTRAAAAYLALGVVVIYGLFVGIQLRHPEAGADTMIALRILASASPYDGAWWLLFFISNAVTSGLLGAFGLLQVMSLCSQRKKVFVQPPGLLPS